MEKKIFDKLCERYIKDTRTFCGTMFCGHKKNECISYMDIETCKVCLIDRVKNPN